MDSVQRANGWLPGPVQAAANVALRVAGLVPLVELTHERSVSLRRPEDDHELAVAAMVCGQLCLFVADAAGDCVELRGEDAIGEALRRYADSGYLLVQHHPQP